MVRPTQVVPLLLAAAVFWLAHLALLAVTTEAATGYADPESTALGTGLAELAFWTGLLLLAAALLLLVLTWDRRARDPEQQQEPAGIDYYA